MGGQVSTLLSRGRRECITQACEGGMGGHVSHRLMRVEGQVGTLLSRGKGIPPFKAFLKGKWGSYPF